MSIKNKKILLAVVFVAVLAVTAVLIVTQSGNKAGPKETLLLTDAAKKVFSDLDSLTAYDGEELYDIVGVAPEDYTEFVYRTGENDIGLIAREIILVRAKDGEAVNRVLEALGHYRERRQTETRTYAPDIYAMLEKSAVSRKDLTAALIISEDSAKETQSFLSGE